MTDDTDWRLFLPPALRTVPADIVGVVAWTALTVVAVFAPVLSGTPLRVVLGLPFVLFIPGYALISALFPEAGEPPTEDDAESDRGGIDGIERVALSFGLSIAVVPLLGLALNFTPFGIRLAPVIVTITAFTVGAAAVAVHRRRALPEAERFRVPYREWVAGTREELFEPDTTTDAALNVVLALSVVLAVASVGYAVAVPQQGEAFTELYLLTEDDDGDLVADDYPTEMVVGESESVVVGVGNHEHEPVTYTVLVELQRVAPGNNSTVLEKEELDRFTERVAAGDTMNRTQTLDPTTTGEELRLAFLLYKSSPPAEPTVENAYRETHLWVNVTQSASTESTAVLSPAA